jgi:hypothetical protein
MHGLDVYLIFTRNNKEFLLPFILMLHLQGSKSTPSICKQNK